MFEPVHLGSGHHGKGIADLVGALWVAAMMRSSKRGAGPIVVSMQNEKSQIQNRAAALRVLQSRLLLLKKEQEDAEKKALAGDVKAERPSAQPKSVPPSMPHARRVGSTRQ